MADKSFATNHNHNNNNHIPPPPPSSSSEHLRTTPSTSGTPSTPYDTAEMLALRKQHRATQDSLAVAQSKIDQMTAEMSSLEKARALALAKSAGSSATGYPPVCSDPLSLANYI